MAWLVSLLVINLHHINARQVLLHLLTILDTLAVDHVVDVLNFVWAHVVELRLLGSLTDTKDSLIDG